MSKKSEKLKSFLSQYGWLSVVVAGLLVAGGIALAGIVNNFSGPVTIYQSEAGGLEQSLGAVSAVGGVCDGSEPAVQMCNVNTYEMEIQTDLTVDGDAIVTGSSDVSEFTQGGGVYSTSTSNSSETLAISDLEDYSYIEVTPLAGNLTLTLPATSTMTTLLPNAGDYRQWIIENAATAATTTTIAAGSGIDLQEPDGQNVIIGQNNFAVLTCYRRSDTDVVCVVDETIPAD